MKDAYRGDSNGKRIARFHAWFSMIQTHRAGNKVLVLAGREGGDISCMLAMGVSKEDIVAVDHCPAAVRSCRERFPGIDIREGSVTEVAFALGKSACDIVFLDFCDYVDDAMILLTSRVLNRCLKKGGVAAVGYLRGRERTGKAIRSRMVDPLSTDGRTSQLWLGIAEQPMMRTRDCLFWPISEVRYHSREEHRHGVPMAISVALSVNCDTFGRMLKEQDALGCFHAFANYGSVGDEAFRAHAVAFARSAKGPSKDIAAALNISAGTLAAWLAHDTRGTYAA